MNSTVDTGAVDAVFEKFADPEDVDVMNMEGIAALAMVRAFLHSTIAPPNLRTGDCSCVGLPPRLSPPEPHPLLRP